MSNSYPQLHDTWYLSFLDLTNLLINVISPNTWPGLKGFNLLLSFLFRWILALTRALRTEVSLPLPIILAICE